MAHTRKDTLVPPPEWWKHLRPFNKGRVARSERRAARELIADQMEDGWMTTNDHDQNPEEEQGQAAFADSSAHGRLP